MLKQTKDPEHEPRRNICMTAYDIKLENGIMYFYHSHHKTAQIYTGLNILCSLLQ